MHKAIDGTTDQPDSAFPGSSTSSEIRPTQRLEESARFKEALREAMRHDLDLVHIHQQPDDGIWRCPRQNIVEMVDRLKEIDPSYFEVMTIRETAMSKNKTRTANDVVMTAIYSRWDGTVKVCKLTRKRGWFLASILLALCLWFSAGSDALSSWAKRQDEKTQRPIMEKLANDGKDYAALWLVQHFPEESAPRLPALVAKGYPEALLFQGLYMARDGDKKGARKMIEEAAEKGYMPAIQTLDRNVLLQL